MDLTFSCYLFEWLLLFTQQGDKRRRTKYSFVFEVKLHVRGTHLLAFQRLAYCIFL